MASQGGASQPIDVGELDLQQLSEVRKQLEQELQHLTQSFGQLRGAQTRFRSGLDALDAITPQSGDKTTLIPLTASLYVPGKLTDTKRVMVDVGTGYYISKTIPAAKALYKNKVEFVSKNLETLQNTITRKQDNMRVVVDVMRAKSMAQQAQ